MQELISSGIRERVSFDERVQALVNLERELCGRFPAASLETRRRVAERHLFFALWSKRPLQECARLLHKVESLGYSNLDLHNDVLLHYLYHLARRAPNDARAHLEWFREETRGALSRATKQRLARYLRATLAEIERILRIANEMGPTP